MDITTIDIERIAILNLKIQIVKSKYSKSYTNLNNKISICAAKIYCITINIKPSNT